MITKWKSPKNLGQILPSFILYFPFHQRWSYFCKWNFKTKKQRKTKAPSDNMKISGCLMCQNQALDYFSTSDYWKHWWVNLKATCLQTSCNSVIKWGFFTWKLQWSECALTGQSENDLECWCDPTARKADANPSDCSPEPQYADVQRCFLYTRFLPTGCLCWKRTQWHKTQFQSYIAKFIKFIFKWNVYWPQLFTGAG